MARVASPRMSIPSAHRQGVYSTASAKSGGSKLVSTDTRKQIRVVTIEFRQAAYCAGTRSRQPAARAASAFDTSRCCSLTPGEAAQRSNNCRSTRAMPSIIGAAIASSAVPNSQRGGLLGLSASLTSRLLCSLNRRFLRVDSIAGRRNKCTGRRFVNRANSAPRTGSAG